MPPRPRGILIPPFVEVPPRGRGILNPSSSKVPPRARGILIGGRTAAGSGKGSKMFEAEDFREYFLTELFRNPLVKGQTLKTFYRIPNTVKHHEINENLRFPTPGLENFPNAIIF